MMLYTIGDIFGVCFVIKAFPYFRSACSWRW